jgi:hypothetical protein
LNNGFPDTGERLRHGTLETEKLTWAYFLYIVITQRDAATGAKMRCLSVRMEFALHA